jgi:hypothetical protein
MFNKLHCLRITTSPHFLHYVQLSIDNVCEMSLIARHAFFPYSKYWRLGYDTIVVSLLLPPTHSLPLEAVSCIELYIHVVKKVDKPLNFFCVELGA